jgi:hypothetical protein
MIGNGPGRVSEMAIRKELLRNGPISVDYITSPNSRVYKSGIFSE